MFSNSYLAALPHNRLLAANKICDDFFDERLHERPEDVVYMLETLLEEELGLKDLRQIYGDATRDRTNFSSRLMSMAIGRLFTPTSLVKIRTIHRKVKALLAKQMITDPSSVNVYLIELSDDETSRIDELLSDVRNIIRESAAIGEEHKRRLLKIVNKLQGEIDKRYSDFRVFLDGMVETSEALGEAGENVKPVFDRIKDMLGIADRARKTKEALEAPPTTEALPPPDKQLPPPE